MGSALEYQTHREDSMIDRTTKALLGLIAAGPWANAMVPLLKPTPAQADSKTYLSTIDSNIAKLVRGTCVNSKLC
jgi:hypothetical protein